MGIYINASIEVTTPGTEGIDVSRISGADNVGGFWEVINVNSGSGTAWDDVDNLIAASNNNPDASTFVAATQTNDQVLVVRDDNNWALFEVTGVGDFSSGGLTSDAISVVNMEFEGTPAGFGTYTVYRDSNGVNVRDAIGQGDDVTSTQQFTLYPDNNFDILVDISTVEAGNIGQIAGSQSRDFTFRATEEINRFFNYAYTVGGQLVPGTSTAIPVSISNEETTLAQGTMILKNWDESMYVCSFQDSIIVLADALEGKKLRDADWSSTDHTYTMDNAISVNNQALLPRYIYPLIDFGFDSEGRPRVPDDEVLPNVAPANSFNQQGGVYNNDYFQQQYNRIGFTQQVGQTNRLIQPSVYFGEIATGQVFQGYITHPATPLRIDQLLPAVGLRPTFDAIIGQAGATYEADFIDMLADVYIQPKANDGLGFNANFTDDKGFIATSTATYTIPDINRNNRAQKSSGGRTIWQYGTGITENVGFNPGNNYSSTNGVYTAPETGTYEFQFNGSLGNLSGRTDNFFNNAYWNGRMSIIVAGQEVGSIDVPRIGNNDDFNDGDNWEFDLKWQGLVYSGQQVTARFITGPSRGADDLRLDIIGPDFRTLRTPQTFDGESISIGDQFGDEDSINVLSAIGQKLNLVAYNQKDRRNHYIFQQYYDWILAGNRVDWSDKVSNIRLTSISPDLNKNTIFTDTEDDDRLNKQVQDRFVDVVYGQHVNTNNSDTVTGSETIGDFFGPLVVASPSQAGDVVKNIQPDPQNGIPHLYDYSIDDGASSMQTKTRIGYRKVINLQSDIFYVNAAGNVARYPSRTFVTLSNTNDAGTEDLNYSSEFNYSDSAARSAFDRYWAQYVNHLEQEGQVKLTADVFFTPSEYASVQLNDTVHIKGTDYLINSIKGFNLSRPGLATVEFLRYNNNFVNVFEEPRNRFIEDDSLERTHLLGVRVLGYDDPSAPGAQPIPMSVDVEDDVFWVTGDPTEVETRTLRFAADPARYTISASNLESNVASLTGITLGTPVDNADGSVSVDVTITVGSNHQYSLLEIEFDLNVLIGDTNTVNINYTAHATNFSSMAVLPANPQPFVFAPGSRIPVLAVIAATAGSAISTNNLPTPTITVGGVASTVVTHSQFTSGGTGVIWYGVVEIPQIDTTTVDIEFQIPDANVSSIAGVDTSMVSITFDESPAGTGGIANVSLSRTSVNLVGVVGTTADFSVISTADSGYELNAMNFSLTETVTWLEMFNSVGSGSAVISPFEVTFPATDESTTIVVNGAAQLIGEPTSNVTVNFTGVPTNTSLTETTETFVLNEGQSVPYTNTLAPDDGFQLDTAITLTETDPDNAISNLSSNQTKFQANISMLVTAGATDTTSSIAIGDVVAVQEPYVLTLNLSEDLPNGKLSTTSYTQRFGMSDITLGSVTFTGITIRPVTDQFSYADTTTFTVTGGTASNYSYSDGSVSFDLTITLPTFGSGAGEVPLGDITQDVSISMAASPTLMTLTDADWAQSEVTLPYNADESTLTVGFTTNGALPASNFVQVIGGTAGITIASTTFTDNAGSVTFNVADVTSDGDFSVALTDGVVAANVQSLVAYSSLNIRRRDFATMNEVSTSVGRTYELGGGSAGTTWVVYPVGVTTTSSRFVPAGDSIEIESRLRPAQVSGDGMLTDLGIVATSATNSQNATQWNTYNMVVDVGGTAGSATNTIYFN